MVIILIAGLWLLLLAAIPAILAYVILSRVPPEHRRQEPGLAFLLLIPFFSIVWAFFVHPRVAESLRRAFEAKGDRSHGDCGGQIALWLCICGVAALVPFVGIVAALASLILLIVFYVKAFDLAGQLQRLP